MLELLDDGNIVNDAEEMEILYLKAKSTANTDEKAETLKKAFELYQGCLIELGELDIGYWLIPYTTHYNQVFIDITRELLAMLGHSRDYHRVIEYASRALSLEPGIQDAVSESAAPAGDTNTYNRIILSGNGVCRSNLSASEGPFFIYRQAHSNFDNMLKIIPVTGLSQVLK